MIYIYLKKIQTLTSLLLPTSVYQNASGSFLTSIPQSLSGNWQSTYQTVCALSANWNNAYASTTALNLSNGNGCNPATNFGAYLYSTILNNQTVAATEVSNSASENLHTRQRKIMSKMLAIANLISIRGRRGPATFIVTNGQVCSALQDVAGFVPAPMANTINQMSGSLYPIGTLAGLAIYNDPNRPWNDTRFCVGRKGDGNSPGLVFMPYLMAESVQTIAEGTMAPKVAVKSRYALVEAGFHPETMYLTSGVNLNSALGSLV